MVQCAKGVAINIDDQSAIDSWRRRNGLVSKKYFSTFSVIGSVKLRCGLPWLVSEIKACLSLQHQLCYWLIPGLLLA